MQHRFRFPLMALAGLSLLASLWAGLIRLGFNFPSWTPGLPAYHGPLIIVGFLGTVIGLERAVAVPRLWPYGAPVFTALAALALLAGLPAYASQISSVLGSLFLLSIFTLLYRQHPSNAMATMGAGALLWFLGNLFWSLGFPLYRVVPWWIGFLVLTIAGERLELARLLSLSLWDRIKFLLASMVFLSGLVISAVTLDLGIWLSGLGLLSLAFWLFRYDIAWRTVRHEGLPRFMAICLLSGYLWLAIGGVLWMAFAELFAAGPRYDAMLHAVLLGFVFSMIFAHAPIIFPSVTGLAMPFRSAFYGHLVLLHLSLLLRVGGDITLWLPGQQWGGLLNALSLLLFLANNVRAVKLGKLAALGRA